MKPDDKENWGNPQACLNMMDFINFLRANIFWRPARGEGQASATCMNLSETSVHLCHSYCI